MFMVNYTFHCNTNYEAKMNIPWCPAASKEFQSGKTEQRSFLSMKESHVAQKDFFTLESLGIVVNPKCGRCKCSKCPVPGVRYTQREEAEFWLIKENLKRNLDEDGWITSYPLLHPRELLRGDCAAGMRSLLLTERSLKKDPIAR